jgi:Glycosyl hydrolase family 26
MNSGAADAIWAKAANYFKTYPFPIMLRTFAEFDGPWFTYGYGYNGDYYSATEFKNAWQRMVNIFRANGATNVGFWWTPQEGGVFAGSGGGTTSRNMLVQYYPGDAYVDWVGADIYNVALVGRTDQYATPLHSGWASFSEIFNYTGVTSAAWGGPCPLVSNHDAFGPRKPFVPGETSSWYDSNYPTYKGKWFADIPAAAKNMRYLLGIQFFDWDASHEYPLNNFMVDYPTSNPSVYAGYKALAADPWFNTGSTG